MVLRLPLQGFPRVTFLNVKIYVSWGNQATHNNEIPMNHTNQKIHALLVDEEMARLELSKNIEIMATVKLFEDKWPIPIEQVLIAFKDYMVGIKELTDLLKETAQPCECKNRQPCAKAPDTMRCVAPDKTNKE
jgi:hypothetical protein